MPSAAESLGIGAQLGIWRVAFATPYRSNASRRDAAALPVAGLTALYGIERANRLLLGSGDAVVEGFNLYHEARVEPAAKGLARLLELVRTGALNTFMERIGAWTEIGQTAFDLLERRFRGKAVLDVR